MSDVVEAVEVPVSSAALAAQVLRLSVDLKKQHLVNAELRLALAGTNGEQFLRDRNLALEQAEFSDKMRREAYQVWVEDRRKLEAETRHRRYAEMDVARLRSLLNLRRKGEAPLKVLGLNTRATNALLAEYIETVGDLAAVLRDRYELLKVPNVGKKTAAEIRAAFEAYQARRG